MSCTTLIFSARTIEFLSQWILPNSRAFWQVVSLLPVDDPDGAGSGGMAAGEDGAKYPYRCGTVRSLLKS